MELKLGKKVYKDFEVQKTPTSSIVKVFFYDDQWVSFEGKALRYCAHIFMNGYDKPSFKVWFDSYGRPVNVLGNRSLDMFIKVFEYYNNTNIDNL